MGRQSFRGLIHERVFHPSPGPVRQYQQSTSTDRTNHQRSHFTLRWSGDEADLLSVHQLSSTRYGAESKTTACNPTRRPKVPHDIRPECHAEKIQQSAHACDGGVRVITDSTHQLTRQGASPCQPPRDARAALPVSRHVQARGQA